MTIPLSLAAEEFLAQRSFSAGTRQTYGASLRRLVRDLHDPPVDTLTSEQLHEWFDRTFFAVKPTTWNRERETLRSALRFWNEVLGLDLELRVANQPEKADRTRALTQAQVEWLLKRGALRERTLWSLLYSTAARVGEVLALDVPDLDRPHNRAKVRSKGGDLEYVWWDGRTAQLLTHYLRGRTTGPVFIHANGSRPRRLGYTQAALQFREATGWTLHQLRHSRLTHLAEQGASTPMLMTKSRHRSVGSLAQYAIPTATAVQRWEEEHA